MSIIQTANILRHHIEELQVISSRVDFCEPGTNIEKIEFYYVALPLIGSISLRVKACHILEVGDFLVHCQLCGKHSGDEGKQAQWPGQSHSEFLLRLVRRMLKKAPGGPLPYGRGSVSG